MDSVIDEMKRVVDEERKSLATFVRLLCEAEKKKLPLEMGYSTLSFCMEVLGLSRSSSLKRILASRVCARFPDGLNLIESGSLHLSALVLLSKHLTEDNYAELFHMAHQKSESYIERELAKRFPREKRNKERIEWLNENEAEVALVLPADVLAMLERARELLKHKYPQGKVAEILTEILSAYLKKNDPLQKEAPRERSPKARPFPVHPRKIRHRIQHQVWKVNQVGQCEYVSPDGKRCSERSGLQIEHKLPWALGGSSLDVTNLQLLCGPHNRFLAEKMLGPRPRAG